MSRIRYFRVLGQDGKVLGVLPEDERANVQATYGDQFAYQEDIFGDITLISKFTFPEPKIAENGTT